MLHKLELKNFKQHQDLTVDFTTGLNTINGENGAGKSTILRAIMYALFGASAAGNKSHLSTRGSSEKMEVALYADISGKSLVITRGFDKATVEGETLLAAGHTPCTKYIEQELGLDAKTFKHLLYAAQGETQSLLKLGAADLQRKIEIITKIDGIDKVVGLIAGDLQTLEGKMSIIPEVSNLEELSNKLGDLRVDEQVKALHIAEQEKMSVQLDEKLIESRKDLNEVIIPAVQKARETKAAEKALNTSLAQIEADLERHEKGRPAETSKIMLAEQAAIETYIKASQSKLDKATVAAKELNRFAKEADAADKAMCEFEALKPKFIHRDHLWTVLRDTEVVADKAAYELAALQQIEADCPNCGRAYDEDLAVSHAIKLKEAKRQLQTKNAHKTSALFIWEEFASKNKGILGVEFEATLEKLLTVSLKAELDYDSAKSNPNLLNKDIFSELSTSLTGARADQAINDIKLRSTERWEQAKESLFSQKARVLQGIAGLDKSACPWTEAGLAKSEADIAYLQEKYQEVFVDLTEARFNLKELQRNKADYVKVFDVATEADKLRKELETERAHRKELQAYLRSNRARLLADTWGNITALTSAYTSAITGGSISGLSRDDSGSFTAQEAGDTVPVEELSGGQQGIVGLALRIALGQTFFGDSSFILLDEVTSDLSDTNAAAVAGMLQGLGMQTIMVSHRAGDSASATNIIVL